MNGDAEVLVASLIEAGRWFHQRGWLPATGGNFSARVAPNCILVTASGRHKGELQHRDFIPVDLDGRSLRGGKPSYETALHLQLYRQFPDVGAVVHVHSVAATVLSRLRDCICLSGYELLKVLPKSPDPSTAIEVPVFENDQDIKRLSCVIKQYMERNPDIPAYLVRGHGVYVWGADPAQARYRVEAIEFMFECELHEASRNR